MDLQTAIERAKSALEHRVFVNETIMIPRAKEGSPGQVQEALDRELHLDTEALQTLPEWKLEEKE